MVLKYEKQGHIAIFTLNRPEHMNAKNMEMFRRLEETMIDFRDDPDMWVGVITGAGDKAFCAGADVKDALPYMREHRNEQEAIGRNIIRGLDVWKPFIAAVNGVAYGGGCELALACDFRIAAENARFAQAEIWVGAMPGGGGTQRLIRFIPRCKAAEILLMGKIIDAQEAYRIGLVNEVVPLNQLMLKAMEYAEAICQWSPVAIRAIKEAMIRGADMTLADGMRLEKLLFSQVIASEDFEEGIRAFREKRKPNFKGR
ncbi:MAG: enoyl-CoA hydratase-related protein [Dehalococcoidia bacterium]|nr:enoyl-CoA hydratase-related protein [Dehalococcoidia bacterium]